MGIRHDLQRSIQKILSYNRSGSFATQANRKNILLKFSSDLISLGYGLRDIHGLKQKHILSVVKLWQKNDISSSTIKNRTATLRYLCKHLNKHSIVPSNDQMKIAKRIYTTRENRALHNPNLNTISNQYIRISLELQRVFGLRREEALKIKPHMADKGDKLELLSSWCKGGRSRDVPIITEEQRYWLEEAKKIAGKFGHSLIPPNKNYIQQRNVYEKQVMRAGLKNLHGLRHAYAQRRYKELTGWDAAISGGLKSVEMTAQQKEIDYKARMILTEELGHSREQITVNYCGR